MIPFEVGKPTFQRQIEDWEINNECLRTNLDLIEELIIKKQRLEKRQ